VIDIFFQFIRNHSVLITGCPQESEEALDCLRKLPVESFIPDPSEPCTQVMHLSAIDGVFIPDDPMTLLRAGKFNKDVDVMLGTMATEGYIITSHFAPDLLDKDVVTMEHVEGFFASVIKTKYPDPPEYIIHAMVKKAVETYVHDTRAEGLIKALTDFHGDALIAWPTYLFALRISAEWILSMQHRV
jgi:hypothetical protein